MWVLLAVLLCMMIPSIGVCSSFVSAMTTQPTTTSSSASLRGWQRILSESSSPSSSRRLSADYVSHLAITSFTLPKTLSRQSQVALIPHSFQEFSDNFQEVDLPWPVILWDSSEKAGGNEDGQQGVWSKLMILPNGGLSQTRYLSCLLQPTDYCTQNAANPSGQSSCQCELGGIGGFLMRRSQESCPTARFNIWESSLDSKDPQQDVFTVEWVDLCLPSASTIPPQPPRFSDKATTWQREKAELLYKEAYLAWEEEQYMSELLGRFTSSRISFWADGSLDFEIFPMRSSLFHDVLPTNVPWSGLFPPQLSGLQRITLDPALLSRQQEEWETSSTGIFPSKSLFTIMPSEESGATSWIWTVAPVSMNWCGLPLGMLETEGQTTKDVQDAEQSSGDVMSVRFSVPQFIETGQRWVLALRSSSDVVVANRMDSSLDVALDDITDEDMLWNCFVSDSLGSSNTAVRQGTARILSCQISSSAMLSILAMGREEGGADGYEVELRGWPTWMAPIGSYEEEKWSRLPMQNPISITIRVASFDTSPDDFSSLLQIVALEGSSPTDDSTETCAAPCIKAGICDSNCLSSNNLCGCSVLEQTTLMTDCNGQCSSLSIPDTGDTSIRVRSSICCLLSDIDCQGNCGGDSQIGFPAATPEVIVSQALVCCPYAEVPDCSGVCGGSAVEDVCQQCNGGLEDPVYDCNNKCGGSTQLDACNVCGGTDPYGYSCVNLDDVKVTISGEALTSPLAINPKVLLRVVQTWKSTHELRIVNNSPEEVSFNISEMVISTITGLPLPGLKGGPYVVLPGSPDASSFSLSSSQPVFDLLPNEEKFVPFGVDFEPLILGEFPDWQQRILRVSFSPVSIPTAVFEVDIQIFPDISQCSGLPVDACSRLPGCMFCFGSEKNVRLMENSYEKNHDKLKISSPETILGVLGISDHSSSSHLSRKMSDMKEEFGMSDDQVQQRRLFSEIFPAQIKPLSRNENGECLDAFLSSVCYERNVASNDTMAPKRVSTFHLVALFLCICIVWIVILFALTWLYRHKS